MIRWLLNLLGIPPKVAAERRRSLVERLNDPVSEESLVMARAQAALDRHRRREEAIARHQAQAESEKVQQLADRKEHQSEIAESTISLNRVRRKTDEIRKKRLRANVPNPFDLDELARREAQRRHEA